MTIKNDNIYFVGVLQDFGKPYSSLYVDKITRQLYLLVRVSPPTSTPTEYAITEVSPQEISSYLNEKIGLTSIFGSRASGIAKIENNKIVLEKGKTYFPEERMKKMDYFDPESFTDDVWVDVFLNRLINNKPLEYGTHEI